MMIDKDYKLLADMGWEFIQTAADDWEWVKWDADGEPVAKGGDDTWHADIEGVLKSNTP